MAILTEEQRILIKQQNLETREKARLDKHDPFWEKEKKKEKLSSSEPIPAQVTDSPVEETTALKIEPINPAIIQPEFAKDYNPFVNPSDSRPYEKQRNDFIGAAKLLAKAAFTALGISEEEAQRIIDTYEKMYSDLAKLDDPSSDIIRYYHVLSHPLVQMLSFAAGKVLLQIQEKLKSGNVTKDNIAQAYELAITELAKNPDIALEVRNKLRHDVIQINGTDPQKDAIDRLKRLSGHTQKWTLEDLVEGRGEFSDSLKELGFGSQSTAMRAAIELAAKQFFPDPDGNGGYNKTKTFEGQNSGVAEFVSAVYCFYMESNYGEKTLPLDEAVQMNIFLAGTIPFQKADHFNNFPENTLKALTSEQKQELLAILSKDSNFQKECIERRVEDHEQMEYWLSKKASEACLGANDDVINFAKDPVSLYYGDLSYRSEIIMNFPHRKGKDAVYVPDIKDPQERAVEIIGMIREHQKSGYVRTNAENEVIYHSFRSKWEHLNVLNDDLVKDDLVKDLHGRYKKNSETVIKIHQVNLLQAALEFIFKPTGVQLNIHSIPEDKLESLSKRAESMFSTAEIMGSGVTAIMLGNDLMYHAMEPQLGINITTEFIKSLGNPTPTSSPKDPEFIAKLDAHLRSMPGGENLRERI